MMLNFTLFSDEVSFPRFLKLDEYGVVKIFRNLLTYFFYFFQLMHKHKLQYGYLQQIGAMIHEI